MNLSRLLPSTDNRNLHVVNANLLGFAVLGAAVTGWVWWDRCAVALLWACAAAAGGFIVGFIFGFPRTIAQPVLPATTPEPPVSPAPSPATTPLDSARAARLSVNTNLEQVSDWITKTIVALGLVELRQLPRKFANVARYVSETTGRPWTGSGASGAAAALLIYFLTLGFLAGYLLTRMFFQSAFAKGDHELENAVEILRHTALASSIVENGAESRQASEQVTAAAEKLKDMSPAAASASGIGAAAIARANLVTGDSGQAVTAYRSAITQDPMNPRLRFEYAVALQRTSSSGGDVLTALRDAVVVESQKPDPDLRRRIYESLTWVELYQPAPEGFTGAIHYGRAYADDASNLPSSIVWANLAAAYGQQAAWLVRKGEPADASVRSRALEAVKEALRLNASIKPLLISLLEPGPDAIAKGEDDLAAFRTDPDFRQLLDLPVP